jgi:excisionase family DNA binding protein
VSAVGIEQHYTTAELAELFAVHPETIRRAAGRGELRSVRIGRDRRYPESAVLEWLGLLTEEDWA